jgi:hypothetical protein
MPFITRDDGERFIIPAYRDILSAKKKSLLKREIIMLSQNYGEYITLQRKNAEQYELAFSPEPGFLLGECVWQHFNRPYDMLYCEAIAGTTEAILVIVKSGSVYLDGSFPIDSIVDELLIFKSQQNNFAIFIHGDVPISEEPTEGCISFDASSVRSFTVLEEPVFPTLPGVKAFQLQLVDVVLKANNIGTLPIKSIAAVTTIIAVAWFTWDYLQSHQHDLPVSFIAVVNPYEEYSKTLNAPDAGKELIEVMAKISLLYSLPGWDISAINYTAGNIGSMKVTVISKGGKVQNLFDWARSTNAFADIKSDGIYLTLGTVTPPRRLDYTISRFQDVLGTLLDRMSYLSSGNKIVLTSLTDKTNYKMADISINIEDMAPATFMIMGDLLANMPLVLNKATLSVVNGNISGTLTLKALGN